MKKKIINGILAAAILVAAPSAFVSCKDNDADLRTELLGKIADLRNRLDQIQQKEGPAGPAGQNGQNGKDGKDGSVVTIGDNGNWFIDGKDTGVPATGPQGDPGAPGAPGENGTIGSVITIGDNGNWFIDGKDSGVPATGPKGDQGDKGKDADIPAKISIGENGNWFIDGNDTGVPATGPKGADGINGTDGTNGVDGITPVLVKGDDGHWYWWIKGEYTGVRADGDAGVIIGGSNLEINNGTWWIDGVDTHVLAYTYEEMVKLIKDQIYNAERDGLTPELEDQIKKLLNNLDNAVQKSIQDMVTDVIAERTQNSAFGEMAIPGWNPLVLSAFYGETTADVTFPDPAIDIKGVAEDIDAGTEIKGDGGKIFVTLNPAEVTLIGKEVTLETSTGKTSPFTLSPLTESNEEITFGWNRTRNSSNGLYEVSATLTNASASGIAVDKDILKSDAKQVLDDLRSGAKRNAIKSLATFMADAFTDAIETVPAYTVKVSWNDALLGPRSVRSGYDIAAFSLKPLAYTFEYGLNVSVKPYVDKVQTFIDKVLDKMAKDAKGYLPPKVTPLNIKKIEINGDDVTITIHIDATNAIPVNEFADGSGAIVGYLTGDKTITIKDDRIKEVAEELTKVYTSIDDLNKLIDYTNNLDEKVESGKNSLKAQIHDYLGVLVGKINKGIGQISINQVIQPTLLVKDANGLHRATGSYSGQISLVPTSYTAELLAPAYKKFIAVIKVNGSDAVASDNPGDLATVLDGGVQEISFTPKAGETYEIAYSAMDYFGNVVTNTYIISGK